MKTIFFNSDEFLINYYKDKEFDFGAREIIFTDKSPSDYNENFDAEIISVITHFPLTADDMRRFPNLKLIASRSQGINHIDMEYVKANNITVKNCNGYGEFAVSEFAMGLLLSLMRRIIPAHNDMLSGNVDMHKYMGRDIRGKTIGVFGMGTIGTAFAKLATAFGANVIVYDRHIISEFKNVKLDELYAESDIIALNIPATKENYHIINQDSLSKMKDGVVILNIARGELIDMRSLYDAFMSGKVGGIAADVLENENIINESHSPRDLSSEQMEIALLNKKMMRMPHVILTPHIAFNSKEACEKILYMTYRNIINND